MPRPGGRGRRSRNNTPLLSYCSIPQGIIRRSHPPPYIPQNVAAQLSCCPRQNYQYRVKSRGMAQNLSSNLYGKWGPSLPLKHMLAIACLLPPPNNQSRLDQTVSIEISMERSTGETQLTPSPPLTFARPAPLPCSCGYIPVSIHRYRTGLQARLGDRRHLCVFMYS